MKKFVVNKILLPVPAQLAELGDTIERLLNTQHIQLESIAVQRDKERNVPINKLQNVETGWATQASHLHPIFRSFHIIWVNNNSLTSHVLLIECVTHVTIYTNFPWISWINWIRNNVKFANSTSIGAWLFHWNRLSRWARCLEILVIARTISSLSSV